MAKLEIRKQAKKKTSQPEFCEGKVKMFLLFWRICKWNSCPSVVAYPIERVWQQVGHLDPTYLQLMMPSIIIFVHFAVPVKNWRKWAFGFKDQIRKVSQYNRLHIKSTETENVQEISQHKISNSYLSISLCHSPFRMLEANFVSSLHRCLLLWNIGECHCQVHPFLTAVNTLMQEFTKSTYTPFEVFCWALICSWFSLKAETMMANSSDCAFTCCLLSYNFCSSSRFSSLGEKQWV